MNDEKYDEDDFSVLIRHCKMYQFGSGGAPALLRDTIAQSFFSFGLMHLYCYHVLNKRFGK